MARLTHSFRNMERWKTDEEFIAKRKEIKRKYRIKNRQRINENQKKWAQELSEWKNKRCKTCDKLLCYKTKGDYCFDHVKRGRKKDETS